MVLRRVDNDPKEMGLALCYLHFLRLILKPFYDVMKIDIVYGCLRLRDTDDVIRAIK